MPEIQEMEGINLYSDTQTLPTDRMREAMYRARVGDDLDHRDPTVEKLEILAAQRVGKEAALYVPSGHMGNLIALMVHCRPGDEVILESESHMVYYESGSLASIAGLMPRLVKGGKGVLDPTEVQAVLREESLDYPRTRLLCVENSHNRAGGTVTPLRTMQELHDLARANKLFYHLDGARLFNAALALGVDASTIAAYFHSVMFCLSKGLSAPVGSMLAGSKAFISEARRVRKRLGGGMRQSGVLAAAGIVALEEMIDRLAIDHQNARILAEGLAKLPGYQVDLETVQTNMVYVSVEALNLTSKEFAKRLEEFGIKVSTRPPYRARFVTHRHITGEHIETVLDRAKEIAEECLKSA